MRENNGKKTEKIKIVDDATIIASAVCIIIGIAGTIYHNYPMWSWVGFGVGIILGDYIAYKKFGFINDSDRRFDEGVSIAIIYFLFLFIIAPIRVSNPDISSATMETINTIILLIFGAITFPITQYFRTKK